MRKLYDMTSSEELEPILQLWILRLMVPLGGYKQLDEISEALSFSADDTDTVLEEQIDRKHQLRMLKAAHARAERTWSNAPLPDILLQNLVRLSQLINLSENECKIIAFVVLIHSISQLDDAADQLGAISPLKIYRVLSVVLGIDEREMHRLLSKDAQLGRSGLIEIDFNGSRSLSRMLDLTSRALSRGLLAPGADPMSLFRELFAPVGKAQISLADYGHISSEVTLLDDYLHSTIDSGYAGVNIYLYGPPGTGKTELAKALAASLGVQLIAVSVQDEDGDPMTGSRRLCALRSAQEIYRRQQAVLLFDEAEDIFRGGGLFERSMADKHKGWLNEYLGKNPLPVIWISNSISSMDDAFIRRFDRVMKIGVPPLSKRREMTQKICGELIGADAIKRIAASNQLTPAVIERAARVTRRIKEQGSEIDANEVMLSHINGTLKGQGKQPIRLSNPAALPKVYDPGLLNPSQDLTDLAKGVATARSARICLYGPPGTGKTAYARWLSEQIDQPLLMKRASDLMSKWVGGTEENLAEAFHEAEQDHALLLIDEVDSFLQERSKATQSWEVTQVNEMLTQMEAFSGVFIASTNLMDGLDQAALRRFDAKIHFGYLGDAQAARLLVSWCKELEIAAPTAVDQARIGQLDVLTPGDFSALARRHRFSPYKEAAGVVMTLEEECALKQDGKKRRIGFI
ncbi:MAG: ATP-binding protein [Pseudomonadota bacterium]|nr:ATP-binding protein [Pseudomonadota bacterium]